MFDDGRLFISAPGAERGVIVDADGSTRPVTVRSPELPVVNPDRPPMPEVPRPPGAPGPGTTTGPLQPGGGKGGAPGADQLGTPALVAGRSGP